MALRGLIFYTVNEVSEIMQVRVETVLRWIYAKKIKASKLPGSRIWRIREEDIIDFMERGANTRSEFKEHQLEEDIEGVLLDLGYEEEIKKPSKPNKGNDFDNYETHKEMQHIKNNNYEDRFVDNSKTKSTSKIKVHEEKLLKEKANETEEEPKIKPVVNKSDIITMKDGNYVTADKLNTITDEVVEEFVFDEEQAKKPVEEDIALIMIDEKDIHICDDQEETIKLMKANGMDTSDLI